MSLVQASFYFIAHGSNKSEIHAKWPQNCSRNLFFTCISIWRSHYAGFFSLVASCNIFHMSILPKDFVAPRFSIKQSWLMIRCYIILFWINTCLFRTVSIWKKVKKEDPQSTWKHEIILTILFHCKSYYLDYDNMQLQSYLHWLNNDKKNFTKFDRAKCRSWAWLFS